MDEFSKEEVEKYRIRENRRKGTIKESQQFFDLDRQPMGILNIRTALESGPQVLTINSSNGAAWHTTFNNVKEWDEFQKAVNDSGAAISKVWMGESTANYVKRLQETESMEVFKGNGALLIKSFRELAEYGVDLLYFIVDDMTVSFESKLVNGKVSEIYMMEITDSTGQTDAPVKCSPAGVPYDYAVDYIGEFDIRTEAKNISYTAHGEV